MSWAAVSGYHVPTETYNPEPEKKPVFPTKHPFVQNEDGSVSNVILSGEDIMTKDDKYDYTIAFPTMVGGKRYSKDEAFQIAKDHGIENYPRFNSVKEMNQWAEQNHGNIDENGVLQVPLQTRFMDAYNNYGVQDPKQVFKNLVDSILK